MRMIGAASLVAICGMLSCAPVQAEWTPPFKGNDTGGIIAAQAAARAAPDGHTLFITTNTTQSANPHLFKKLPYDPVGDFAPLAAIARGTMVLVVPTSSPYRTVAGHARPPPRRPAAATTARASPASAPAAPA